MASPGLKICHIVVAGGSGLRFGSDIPKQFCEFRGRPVVMHAISALRQATPSAAVVLALNPAYGALWLDLCHRHSFESPEVVAGGATRWESVSNALAAVSPETDIITVHDAARPVVEARVVNNVIAAVADGAAGAIPSVALTDSIRKVSRDGSSQSASRSDFRAVQTPQAFRADILREAYLRGYKPEFTDDASVVESAGFGPIVLTEGSVSNIKITHPADLLIAGIYIDG